MRSLSAHFDAFGRPHHFPWCKGSRRLHNDEPWLFVGRLLMGPSATPPLPGRTAWRFLLLLAAVDTLAVGFWAVLRPADLFGFLQMALPPPDVLPPDRPLLWRMLGVLALAHAGFLAILVWRPEPCGPLVLVPLIGRAAQAGLWLWVCGTDRLQWPSPVRPLALAAHDAVWLPLLAAFLFAWWRWRRSAAGAKPVPLADRESS
jgi:hypothetical protein